MPLCPRCGRQASGIACAACGESLAFAPPEALTVDRIEPAAMPGQGSGWLVATGVIQILLGALWVLFGILFAALSASSELWERMHIEKMPGLMPVFLILFTGGGIATIVVSAFVISRRRWAWIVSLVFDALWAAFGLVLLVAAPGTGVLYLAVSVSLILFLVAGRHALR
jgi:hypothetical protein